MEIKEDRIKDIMTLYEDLNTFLKNLNGVFPSNPLVSKLITETENSQSQFYLLCKFVSSYGDLTKSLSILMSQIINLTPDGIDSLKTSLTEFLNQVLKAQDTLFDNTKGTNEEDNEEE